MGQRQWARWAVAGQGSVPWLVRVLGGLGLGAILLGGWVRAGWLADAADPTPSASPPSAGVYLTACQADVQVWVGRWGRWIAAFPQMRLEVGDQVKTGSAASAQIEFGSRAVVRLAEKTLVVVLRDQVAPASGPLGTSAVVTGTTSGPALEAAAGPVAGGGTSAAEAALAKAKPALRVQVGQVWVQVAKGVSQLFDFAVETPTAWAGVRGTVFAVTVESDGSTWVTVEEGLVEVNAAGASVWVSEGERVRVPAHPRGSPPHKEPPEKAQAGPEGKGKSGAATTVGNGSQKGADHPGAPGPEDGNPSTEKEAGPGNGAQPPSGAQPPGGTQSPAPGQSHGAGNGWGGKG